MHNSTEEPKSQDKTLVNHGWFALTNDLWRMPMPHRAKEVFGVIGSYAGIEDGECYATYEVICEQAKIKRNTLSKALTFLASPCYKGNPLIVRISRGSKKSNLITIAKTFIEELQYKRDTTKAQNGAPIVKRDTTESSNGIRKEETLKKNPPLPPHLGGGGEGDKISNKHSTNQSSPSHDEVTLTDDTSSYVETDTQPHTSHVAEVTLDSTMPSHDEAYDEQVDRVANRELERPRKRKRDNLTITGKRSVIRTPLGSARPPSNIKYADEIVSASGGRIESYEADAIVAMIPDGHKRAVTDSVINEIGKARRAEWLPKHVGPWAKSKTKEIINSEIVRAQ